MASQKGEVLMHLGFATDSFDAAIRQVQGDMGKAAGAIEHHMVRPRAAATAFHHVLGEISSISPVVGTALQAAFNPVVGIIAAVGFAIKTLHEEFKELAKLTRENEKAFEKMSDMAARPTDKPRDVARAKVAAERYAAEDARRIKNEEEAINDPIVKTMENLKRQETQFDLNKDAAGKLAEQQKVLADLEKQSAAAKKPVEDYNSKAKSEERERTAFMISEAKARLKTLEEEANEYKKLAEEHKPKEGSLGESITAGAKAAMFGVVGMVIGGRKEIEAKQSDKIYQENIRAEKDKREAIAQTEEALERLETQQKIGGQTHDDERKHLDKLESAHRQVASAIDSTTKEMERQSEAEKKAAKAKKDREDEFELQRRRLEREQQRAEIEPYMPTAKQLAGLSSWGGDTWQSGVQSLMDRTSIPTREARMAGEMQRELDARGALENQIILTQGKNSPEAMENLERIKELKSALTSAGFMKEDHAAKISERMGELLEREGGKGLKFQPVMGD